MILGFIIIIIIIIIILLFLLDKISCSVRGERNVYFAMISACEHANVVKKTYLESSLTQGAQATILEPPKWSNYPQSQTR